MPASIATVNDNALVLRISQRNEVLFRSAIRSLLAALV